jgi:hypothetical protein
MLVILCTWQCEPREIQGNIEPPIYFDSALNSARRVSSCGVSSQDPWAFQWHSQLNEAKPPSYPQQTAMAVRAYHRADSCMMFHDFLRGFFFSDPLAV